MIHSGGSPPLAAGKFPSRPGSVRCRRWPSSGRWAREASPYWPRYVMTLRTQSLPTKYWQVCPPTNLFFFVSDCNNQDCIREICTWWRLWWAKVFLSPRLLAEDTQETSTNWPSDTPLFTEQQLRYGILKWMSLVPNRSNFFKQWTKHHEGMSCCGLCASGLEGVWLVKPLCHKRTFPPRGFIGIWTVR